MQFLDSLISSVSNDLYTRIYLCFRRLTGIKRDTFNRMIRILEEADKKKKMKGGRKNKLSIENQLLMALEYIREYNTYFHVSQSYGIRESSCYKGIKWIEDILCFAMEEGIT